MSKIKSKIHRRPKKEISPRLSLRPPSAVLLRRTGRLLRLRSGRGCQRHLSRDIDAADRILKDGVYAVGGRTFGVRTDGQCSGRLQVLAQMRQMLLGESFQFWIGTLI